MKLLIVCFIMILSTAFFAQSEMTTITTITVNRSIDGKTSKEVIVIEGDGADEKIKEFKKDKTITNLNITLVIK